jgi:hypothetical protein
MQLKAFGGAGRVARFIFLAVVPIAFCGGLLWIITSGRDWTVMTAPFYSQQGAPFWEDAPKPSTIEAYFREYASGRYGAILKDCTLPTSAGKLQVIMSAYVETESNSRFAGFLLNNQGNTAIAAAWLAQNWDRVLPFINAVSASVTTPGEIPGKEKRTKFSGQIYLYTDGSLTEDERHDIREAFRTKYDVTATFRDFKFLIDSYKPNKIHRLL